MSMSDWARNEIELACKKENPDFVVGSGKFDYGCSCYESALKAYLSIMEDNHSGVSYNFTKKILIKLLNEEPLGPIEDVPEVWNEIATLNNDNETRYQCSRRSSFFKTLYKDGRVVYRDNDHSVGFDMINKTFWNTHIVKKICYEMFPIEMPYTPKDPYKAHCLYSLYDPDTGGDYDTIGIFFIEKPDGELVYINRYFKDGLDDMIEITLSEYLNRISKPLGENKLPESWIEFIRTSKNKGEKDEC